MSAYLIGGKLLRAGGRVVLRPPAGGQEAAPYSITAVRLSQASLPQGAAAGRVIGTLSADASDGLAHPTQWTMNAAGAFALSGASLTLADPNVGPGTYSVSGTAVMGGADNNPYAWTKAVTVLPANGARALFAAPDQDWIALGAGLPAMALSFEGGAAQAWLQLYRFDTAEGPLVAVSSQGPPAGLPAPASVGTYVIRAFADSAGAAEIGRSAPIGVWADASGPASARITLDAPPAQVFRNVGFPLSGTAVTANNYILVGLRIPYETSAPRYQAVLVGADGRWSVTTWNDTPYPYFVSLLDPTAGAERTETGGGGAETPAGAAIAPALLLIGSGDGGGPLTSNSSPGAFVAFGTFAVPPGSPYEGGTTSVVDSDDIGDSYGRVQLKRPPQASLLSVTLRLSAAGQPDVLGTISLPAPYSVPPSSARLDYIQEPNDKLPRFSPVAAIRSYSGDGLWIESIIDPSYSFKVVDRMVVTWRQATPAGTYPIQVRIADGAALYVQDAVITVSPAALLDQGAISYAPPSGVSNTSAIGTSLGTPQLAGAAGTPVWTVVQDRGYRTRCDPATGALQVAKYYSAVQGAETFTLVANTGGQVCVKPVSVPVSAPPGPVLRVGAAQTYATVQQALDAFLADPQGAYANAEILIDPGTYLNSVSMDDPSGYHRGYILGHLKVTGIPDGQGRLPLITFDYQYGFAAGKGAFNMQGFDLWLTNLEIANCRQNLNGGGNSFYYAMQMGDQIDSLHENAALVRRCIIHDCEDGIGRGTDGSRLFIEDTDFYFNADGAGYCHHIYSLGALTSVKRSTFVGGSNGHLYKSRSDVSIIEDCDFIATNDSTPGSLVDTCDGGDLLMTGCRLWSGPNMVNAHMIQYGAEIGGAPDLVHIARGNIARLDNNQLYNLVPAGYYPFGHVQPSGVSNSYDTNPKNEINNVGPADFAISGTTLIGLAAAQRYGDGTSGPVSVSASVIDGPVPSYNGLIGAGALRSGAPGFTAAQVGPTLNPYSDLTYSSDAYPNNTGGLRRFGEFIGQVWDCYPQAPTVPADAAVGTVVAQARMAPSPIAGIKPVAGAVFAYSQMTPLGANPYLDVSASGQMTVKSSLAGMAGQVITLGVDSIDGDGNHNPMLCSVWVTGGAA